MKQFSRCKTSIKADILATGLIVLVWVSGVLGQYLPADTTGESNRSPVNQIFQFMQAGVFQYSDSNKISATAYLWIPENCRRLRGLLIMGRNVTEHTLVGHPAIRNACTASDLGIVWSTPSFYSHDNKDPKKTVAFLKQLLAGLAESSGYEEVARIPWLPMGESWHMGMVDHLLDAEPDGCIAGIYVKNTRFSCRNRETPVLMAVGTAQEWDQEKTDVRTRWNNLAFYDTFARERTAFPNWPASLLVDGGSGHFDCPETMARYFASYITAAVKARVPADPGRGLLPVAQAGGFVVGLPLPGRESFQPISPAKLEPSGRSAPWFFDEELARGALTLASINWRAETQMTAFTDTSGVPVPMTYRGITRPIPIQTGFDGVSFELKGCLLPAVPPNFVAAGTPLARAPGEPSVEWICGPVAPAGQGKFRIALDRTWPECPVYFAVRHRGTEGIRSAVQPGGGTTLRPNTSGAPQQITFAQIPDQAAGTTTVPLEATSDSKMPVEFFVVAGPAVAKNGHLELTSIPPRTRFPVTVTVTAWQWGRSIAPQIQTARPITRSFRMTEK